jgi:predicted small lipoprotein YifL
MVRAISERPMLLRLSPSRFVLVAGLIALALTACGRRGAPEPPPGTATAAPAQAQADGTLPSPVGTPRRNRPGGFVTPNRSFILDPLL